MSSATVTQSPFYQTLFLNSYHIHLLWYTSNMVHVNHKARTLRTLSRRFLQVCFIVRTKQKHLQQKTSHFKNQSNNNTGERAKLNHTKDL